VSHEIIMAGQRFVRRDIKILNLALLASSLHADDKLMKRRIIFFGASFSWQPT
jgi:hypothetical protein